MRDGDDFTLRMMGIGGTGVVTVNQILGMAALIDGLHVAGLDQTGPEPEGRPGHLRPAHLARARSTASSKASAAGVDLYLGFDLLGAAERRRTSRPPTPSARSPWSSTSAVPTGQDGGRHRASASPS